MRSSMPTLFNTIRTCIYCAVLVFTLICLGMAARLESVLESSDLTRFVPFAIFVCCASLLIVVALLGFSSVFRERNPISTRIEIGCLGLAGLLWLVLGVYLAISDSGEAEVECFVNGDSQIPLDDELATFHTDQYHAMYHVLDAFALMNGVLLMGSCFILLGLAYRRHRMGDTHMWYGPVTACAWFNDYGKTSNGMQQSILPTSRHPAMTQTTPTTAPLTAVPVRRERSQRSRDYGSMPRREHSSRSQGRSRANRPTRDRSHRSGNRQASVQSSLVGSYSDEYENGRMANPNRTTSPRR